jgi:hypothetical protein
MTEDTFPSMRCIECDNKSPAHHIRKRMNSNTPLRQVNYKGTGTGVVDIDGGDDADTFVLTADGMLKL